MTPRAASESRIFRSIVDYSDFTSQGPNEPLTFLRKGHAPMGKSQKKRAMRRHNPMRVPDSHLPRGLAAASSSSNKTEAVLPIIKKVELFFFALLEESPLIWMVHPSYVMCIYVNVWYAFPSFQIESADPVERKWACVAISNLIYNDPSTRRLLQGKNVVGTLIGRLTDSEEEVVVEAAGALR